MTIMLFGLMEVEWCLVTLSRDRRGLGSGLFLGWNLEEIPLRGRQVKLNFCVSRFCPDEKASAFEKIDT